MRYLFTHLYWFVSQYHYGDIILSKESIKTQVLTVALELGFLVH
jgi:hypothetical protein